MYFLYNILLHVSLLLFTPYFLFKMALIGKYRKGIGERFGFIGKAKLDKLSGKTTVWFHAVSVGETKAVVPLVKVFKEKRPNVKIIFSTVTATGNAVAMKEGAQLIDSLIYFPLDLNWVVKRVVNKIKPTVFVAVEKEIWPNILKVFNNSNIPVFVVNGIISERSFKRYKLFRFFFKNVFKGMSYFLSQTRESADKAAVLGIKHDRIITTGNLKFDMKPLYWDIVDRENICQRLKITSDSLVFIAGSTHNGEEGAILDVFKELKREFFSLKLIIAPRHPERFKEVEALIKERGFSLCKRSEVDTQTQSNNDVILLDTIGELCKFYSIADIAFIGGTLVDIGGHNLLEPALHKKPILYGPHIRSYIEMAEMLEKAGGGIRVNSKNELLLKTKELFNNKVFREKTGNAAYSIIENNRGATEKTFQILESYLPLTREKV